MRQQIIYPLVVFSVVLGSLGQVSMKQGMLTLGMSISRPSQVLLPLIQPPGNLYVWMGIALYAVGALSWLVVLSHAELSVVYPLISLNYLLVLALSKIIFHEPLSYRKIVGTLLICAGVVILSKNLPSSEARACSPPKMSHG